ncbi:uncharacterized protein LOC134215262 [Armigeres subalbatus]|uniref:uncharacterized protein LOC134215262 n=1 Tax=Armigeres subalbatus TaxID=124917 RepID=UPI002ED00D56
MKRLLKNVFAVIALRAITCLAVESESISSNQTSLSSRQGRVFAFHTIGRIANTLCTGSNGLLGTCQVKGECAANGGIGMGTCSTLSTQATCCVYRATCGGSGSQNITYFQNSGYPAPYNGGGSCVYTVIPPDNTICQLRIDFTQFTLSQPNADGLCTIDNIQISGGSSRVPVICGDNNGQHVYVAFSGTSPIKITVATTASTSLKRVWNLQLSLISCTSTYKAPSGCLQYYLGLTGNIQSFNYGSGASSAVNSVGVTGTRQLANQNYGICIRKGVGVCTVTYRLPTGDPYAFTLTGDVSSATASTLGTAAVGTQGSNCTTDYLIIPNPTGQMTDRFCGMGIATTISSNPFLAMYYITDGNDTPDVANRGFNFLYTQNSCAVSTGK